MRKLRRTERRSQRLWSHRPYGSDWRPAGDHGTSAGARTNLGVARRIPYTEQAAADADLVDKIMALVKVVPGVKQKDLKTRIEGDGPRLGILASSLETGKRLQRVSQGSTFLLHPAGFPPISLARWSVYVSNGAERSQEEKLEPLQCTTGPKFGPSFLLGS